MEIKRGQMWYVRYDDGVGSEEAIGRPVVIISSDRGCETSPVVTVVFCTTRERRNGVSVELTTKGLRKRSWALCNNIQTYDKSRLSSYMVQLSKDDIGKIDAAVRTALGLNVVVEEPTIEEEPEDESLVAVTVERDLYKSMYEKLLEKHMDLRIAADMETEKRLREQKKLFEEMVVEPEPEPKSVTEEPPKPKKSVTGKPKPNWKTKIDVNSCSREDLIEIVGDPYVVGNIIELRKYKSIAEVREVPGMTNEMWETLRTVIVIGGAKVNINTATAQEIHDVTGMALNTSHALVAYRKKNGKFSRVEDIVNVKRITESMTKRYAPMMEV